MRTVGGGPAVADGATVANGPVVGDGGSAVEDVPAVADDRGAVRVAVDTFRYRVLVRGLHHPALIRKLVTLLGALRVGTEIGTRHGVAAAARRTASFSNLAHHDDLLAGLDFVIGMDDGPRQQADREYLRTVLGPAACFGEAAAVQSGALVDELVGRGSFDLVGDYLTHVVWAAMRESFGDAAAAAVETRGERSADGCPFAALYSELRYVGGQLLAGALAPPAARRRAARKAEALVARVRASRDEIGAAWAKKVAEAKARSAKATTEADVVDREMLERNAVGLMWVGHPATVQAGALIVQSLLADRPLYRALREDVRQSALDPWADPALRARLRAHVLELLRFRPPFPILNRKVLRDTHVDVDGRDVLRKAGRGVHLYVLAAMFDPAEVDQPDQYWPGRPDRAFGHADTRYLMFGLGERSCIAKQHVVETLVSALIGVLTMPELRYARRWTRIRYDGPIITSMPLRSA